MIRTLVGGLALSALAALGAVRPTQAATIASWTFETSIPTTAGPLAPEVGAGSATGVHAGAASFTNPSGNGSAESWNSNTWAVGDYYQFQASTTGQSGITFSWDQTRSSAGPGAADVTTPNFRLQYSTDGTNFTNAGDYLVPVVTWDNAIPNAATKYSQNLSAVTALDNQATVFFRLTALLAPQNTGGQSRVDNVTIATIPEPASGALAAAAIVAAAGLRRRDQAA